MKKSIKKSKNQIVFSKKHENAFVKCCKALYTQLIDNQCKVVNFTKINKIDNKIINSLKNLFFVKCKVLYKSALNLT